MKAILVPAEPESEESGAISVEAITALVITTMVLLFIVAALMGTLQTALTNYSTNETTFGPTVRTLVPILIGAGIILAVVAAFLGFAKFGRD